MPRLAAPLVLLLLAPLGLRDAQGGQEGARPVAPPEPTHHEPLATGTRWTWRREPVYEIVEQPVIERREKPRYAIRFVPVYEWTVEPVWGERRVPVTKRHVDPSTGEVREVVCGTRTERVVSHERRRRRLVGYEAREVQVGCSWEDIVVGRERKPVLRGWRWVRVAVSTVPTTTPPPPAP